MVTLKEHLKFQDSSILKGKEFQKYGEITPKMYDPFIIILLIMGACYSISISMMGYLNKIYFSNDLEFNYVNIFI